MAKEKDVMLTKISPIESSPETVETLIVIYGHMVSVICRRMIQDEDKVQDAAQEVWLEVMKSLPTFAQRSKISTWIYTIAYRVVLKCAKKERIYSTEFLQDVFHGEDFELPQDIDLEKDMWVKEMCDKCLTGILHCLDSETRLAYIFRDICQLSYDEMAQIFQKDEQTLRQNVSRTRKKLRNFLNDECVLFNPAGVCRCRLRKWVEEIELPQEYQKLRQTVHAVNLYRESEAILLRKNYWEKYL
jgi:RNA polymerase sigma factor (sigma-70 family)